MRYTPLEQQVNDELYVEASVGETLPVSSVTLLLDPLAAKTRTFTSSTVGSVPQRQIKQSKAKHSKVVKNG